jgi:NADH:ubiquinone oxidoreductase subunit 2 (subunit N)
VGVAYYLRVVYMLYMRPEVEAPEGLRPAFAGMLAVAVAAAATLVLGLLPGELLSWVVAALPGS